MVNAGGVKLGVQDGNIRLSSHVHGCLLSHCVSQPNMNNPAIPDPAQIRLALPPSSKPAGHRELLPCYQMPNDGFNMLLRLKFYYKIRLQEANLNTLGPFQGYWVNTLNWDFRKISFSMPYFHSYHVGYAKELIIQCDESLIFRIIIYSKYRISCVSHKKFQRPSLSHYTWWYLYAGRKTLQIYKLITCEYSSLTPITNTPLLPPFAHCNKERDCECSALTCSSILFYVGDFTINGHFGKIFSTYESKFWTLDLFNLTIFGCFIALSKPHFTANGLFRSGFAILTWLHCCNQNSKLIHNLPKMAFFGILELFNLAILGCFIALSKPNRSYWHTHEDNGVLKFVNKFEFDRKKTQQLYEQPLYHDVKPLYMHVKYNMFVARKCFLPSQATERALNLLSHHWLPDLVTASLSEPLLTLICLVKLFEPLCRASSQFVLYLYLIYDLVKNITFSQAHSLTGYELLAGVAQKTFLHIQRTWCGKKNCLSRKLSVLLQCVLKTVNFLPLVIFKFDSPNVSLRILCDDDLIIQRPPCNGQG
ncbi:hypothetical protein VP01_456g1 [Puccinia sorghi]|uniref:Uncharacterized protein n=1 Tax=Puccinia sorghi TaxID=27349 RepID=A0A0L6UQN5_9BASI|nr:hypothetical protein VP01_456g1 [Puccinia sorghi]